MTRGMIPPSALASCVAYALLAMVLVHDHRTQGQQIKNGDCMYDFTLPENRLMVRCGDKVAITRFSSNSSTAFPTGGAAKTVYQKSGASRPRYNFNYTSVSASTDKDLTLVQQVIDTLHDVNRTLSIVRSEVMREMEQIANAADMIFSEDENLERAAQPYMRRPTISNGGRRRPNGMPPLFRAALGKIQAQEKKLREGVQEQHAAVEEAIGSLETLVRIEGDMVKSTMTLAEVLSRRVKELTAPLVLLESGGQLQQDGNGDFPQPKQQMRNMFSRPVRQDPRRLPYPVPMPQRTPYGPPQYRPPVGRPPQRGPMQLPPNRMPFRPLQPPPRRAPSRSPIGPRPNVPSSVPEVLKTSKPLKISTPVECSPVTSIGSAYMWVHQGTTQGTVMSDYKDQFGRIWVMLGYGGTNQVIEYENDLAFENSEVRNTYVLPFYCEGTGHVVYGGCLYCLQSKTNHIMRYSLENNTLLRESRLISAGVYNTYPYQFGALSDVDFAVDELGLWVIYSGNKYYGRLVISRLNPETLAIEQTWLTNILKKRIGNTFMVCGILYAVDSFTDTPTFIRYVYDTKTAKGQIISPSALPFMNSADPSRSNSFTVMVDYDPKERRLLTWNTGRIEIYQVM